MLHEFITLYRDETIKRCRAKVAARSIPPPSEVEINHGVPMFLDQLVDALRTGDKSRASSADINKSAGEHGHDLLLKGFTVSQVVHDYGDVCQTVTELAVETNAPISAEDFRTLSGLGIGLAFSRWGAEANGGRLYAHNMPGKGCVFTVDVPRSPVTAGNAA